MSDLVNRVVDTTLATLATEPGRRFTQSQIMATVMEKCNTKSRNLVRAALQTLVVGGRCEGSTRGGGWMKHKEGGGTADPEEFERQVQAIRQQNQRALQEMNTIIANQKQELAELKEAGTKERIVEVQLKNGAKEVKVIKGLFHHKFPRVLKLAEHRKNIWLAGPTGCGKSWISEQVAESLGLSYSFVSCTAGMSEGVLGGRLLPTGEGGMFEYIMSEFVNAFEKGGVFLLDELDAADANVMLMINSALASGKLAVTNRSKKPYAKRHKDFVCIAAANTFGTNADRMYSGRNKLDAATLDRFGIGKVLMDYDSAVEEQLCPDETLLKICHGLRKGIVQHRLERAMSTRFIGDAHYMMTEAEWTLDMVFDKHDGFFCGWREDEINKVKQFVPQAYQSQLAM